MRTRSIAFRLFVAAAALSWFPAESSAAPADPSALITELGAEVKLVLGDASLTPIQRQQHFRALLDQNFDFPTIARFVLGRYWQGSSDSFRQEFTGVFEAYVVQSLGADFARYNGESINITGTRAEGEHSTIVSSAINHPNGGTPEIVDWRVQSTAAGYKIADVNIAGVSMAITYRDQFVSVIDRSGGQVTALIPALRQKLDSQPDGSTAMAAQGQDKNR